jgi:broad specificity phosphatase PhoE
MVKNITIIRHAQSLFNSGKVKDEELKNCSLSDVGKTQATELNMSFDILIVSPLKRALETYVFSSIKVKEIRISPLFREFKSWKVNLLDNENETEVETEEEMKKRAIEAMEYLNSLPHVNIGVITHFEFINSITSQFFGKNCALNNCKFIKFQLQ